MEAVRILLVEDDPLVRWLAADALRDEGFDVTEADDGDQAVRKLTDPDHFDVLLTDVRMPGSLDGIEVATCARSLHPAIPVIVVSGYATQVTNRLNAFDPPAIFMAKPYSLKTIIETVRRLAP